MLSFEAAQEALSQLADELPPQVYESLNGGILLLPEVKLHPKGVAGDLYILGEYHVDPYGFGRYITLYYGSFQRVHGYSPDSGVLLALKEVLYHELTHHLESLAGDATLEYKDDDEMQNYLDRHGQ